MSEPPVARSRRATTILAAALVALLAGGAIVTSLGLAGPRPVGTGDNGDGARLYCGAGIVPDTVDGTSNWKNAVVLRFTTGHPACDEPVVSSALPLLRVATLGADETWSLNRLGWLYAVLVAAAAALAALALGPRRCGWLAVTLVPLAVTAFGRLFVSTYSEPAGLLGAVTFTLGVLVVALTAASEHGPRMLGLTLVAVGAVVAATAKPGYAPLALVAVVACLACVTSTRARRFSGLLAAAAVVIVAVPVVMAATSWQERSYAQVNAHDVVFTLALPELGPDAAPRLGLPPSAYERVGEGFFVRGAEGIPGWTEAIADDPEGAHADAVRLVLSEPAAAARAVGIGMQATMHADLRYLPSLPLGLPEAAYPPRPIPPMGEQAAELRGFHAVLAGTAMPWAPSTVAVLGIVAGVAGALPPVRRRVPLAAGLGRVAAVTATTAILLVGAALLGDGYNEIFKHVWLAAYMLAVALLVLGAALGAAVVSLTRHDRSGWSSTSVAVPRRPRDRTTRFRPDESRHLVDDRFCENRAE